MTIKFAIPFTRRFLSLFCVLLLLTSSGLAIAAASAGKIDRDARAALQRLYSVAPETRAVLARAQGVLVFPAIYKAGIGIGAEVGKGALLRGGKNVGYYRLSARCAKTCAGHRVYDPRGDAAFSDQQGL